MNLHSFTKEQQWEYLISRLDLIKFTNPPSREERIFRKKCERLIENH